MSRLERRRRRAGLLRRGGCAGAGDGRRPLRRRFARTPRSVAGCLVAHQTPQTRSVPLTLPPDLARPGACLRTSGRTGTLKKGTPPIVDVHPHLEETP